MSAPLLEICVDDASGLAAAIAGGADRIELCSALPLGGLTPSPGLMALAGACPVPVYAMIRPRGGDFRFSPPEIETMRADIAAVRQHGLAGVVLGANAPDGSLDEPVLRFLMHEAEGLGTTLHRAFDLVPDFAEAVDLATSLGFERILTSGGRPTALEGLDALQEIVAHARGRIAIMPGSGIRPDNAATIVNSLGVSEIHASASATRPETDGKVLALGFGTPTRRITDRETVAALKAQLLAASTR